MTRDDILAMEAGRELDALVAEKVMGRDPLNARHGLRNPRNGEYELSYYWGYPEGHDFAPSYSTWIGDAWKVVEKMVPIKYGFNLAIESPPGPWGDWGVHFYNGGTHLAWADTAPLSICHAALLAVMERDE